LIIRRTRYPAGESKRKIKAVLVIHYKEGMSLTDIVKEVSLEKSVVIDHLNDMRKTKDIVKEKGKRGRYYLNHLDETTAPYLLGHYSIVHVFNKAKHDKINQNIAHFLSGLDWTHAMQMPSNWMTLQLLKLSNKIGALIVAYLIMGLDPDNEFIDRVMTKFPGSKLDRDVVVREWVNDCIHHMWGFLLLQTMECIKPVQERVHVKRNESLFYLDKDAIKLATKSYSKIYPDIYNEIRDVKRLLKNNYR
jgi:hypothetical protein